MVYVFDMDGVLWCMEDPIAYAADAVARIGAAGHAVYFLTNNSSKTRADFVAKLTRFGISTDESHVMTSAYATAQILEAEGARGAAVRVIGEGGLQAELEAVGMRVLATDEPGPARYAVVGWDRGLTYAKLAAVHRAIVEDGADFVATNRDATYPDAGGRTLPGGGAIVAAVETCTGVRARTIGKPEPLPLQLILRAEGATPTDCVVVGDRLDTDIALGRRIGARAVLVLTGLTSAEAAASAPAEYRPDVVIEDLRSLPL